MSAAVLRLFAATDWTSLAATVTPSPAPFKACQDAVAALQAYLTSGTAHLVGSAAADLHLPKCDADIVVLLPDFCISGHAAALSALAGALKGPAGQKQGFSQVQQGQFSVQCSRAGLNLDILVGSSEPAGPLQFLDPSLTPQQRQVLSASTAVGTTAFLQQQPPLFKLAVRLVKHWAKQVHGGDWSDELRNRPKSFLLVLLTLRAYQQYLATAAAAATSSTAGATDQSTPAATSGISNGGSLSNATSGSSSSSNSSSNQRISFSQADALSQVFTNFLRLSAQLSSSTLLAWELHYSREVVQQVLVRPDLAAGLRPKGCEGHPLVLDPSNPTNNVAAAVPGIDRLRQLAASDLAAVDGDKIRQLEQQVQALELACKGDVKSLADIMAQQLQLQQKQIAALVLHSKLSIGSNTTFSWTLQVPVSAWLPGAKPVALSKPWQWASNAPGLWLQAWSIPYNSSSSSSSSSDYLAGIELKLAADETSEPKALAELGLPIRVTVLKSSNAALQQAADSSGYSRCSKALASDVAGVLSGSSSLRLGLSRSFLSGLDLVSHYSYSNSNSISSDDERAMQRYAQGYVVKFNLLWRLGP